MSIETRFLEEGYILYTFINKFIFYINNEVVSLKNKHNNALDAAEIGLRQCLSNIKEISSNKIESTPQQVIAQMPFFSQAISAALPTINAIKKIDSTNKTSR